MKENAFIERRTQYRLPFHEKAIYTSGKNTLTAYSVNLSRGGMFLTSLNPFPLDSVGHLVFFLPNQEYSMCVEASVKHIVFDRQRCEVDCGMGIQFEGLNDAQKALLNLHILNDQSTYMDLQKVLGEDEPDSRKLSQLLRKLPSMRGYDLLELRYRVNRICTLFEPAPDAMEDDSKTSLIA